MMSYETELKPLVWYGYCNDRYQNASLDTIDRGVTADINQTKRSFIRIGFYLRVIKDRELYKDAGYDSIYDYAHDKYGISRSSAVRYMQINAKFSTGGGSIYIDDKYKEFSKSQLQEMLALSEDKLDEIKPEMTIKEIRKTANPEKPEPSDGDIRAFYDWMHIKTTDTIEADALKQRYRHAGGGGSDKLKDYQGSSRGMSINYKKEITRIQLAKKLIEIQQVEKAKVANNAKPRKPQEIECEILNEFAKQLIRFDKKWFLGNYKNRVLDVTTSYKFIAGRAGQTGNRHFDVKYKDVFYEVSIFDDYLKIKNDTMSVNIDSFYVSAAIQSMWNVVVLEDAQEEKAKTTEPAQTSIDILDLPVHTYNTLRRAGIDTVEELKGKDIAAISGVGARDKLVIEKALSECATSHQDEAEKIEIVEPWPDILSDMPRFGIMPVRDYLRELETELKDYIACEGLPELTVLREQMKVAGLRLLLQLIKNMEDEQE